jgi:hypothetical protein
MRGVRKQLAVHESNAKLPITVAMLQDIYHAMDLNNVTHMVLWAAYLLAFFSFLRVSNVAPPSAVLFDPATHLTRADLIFHTNMVVIRIRQSKTIQFKERTLNIPLVAIPHSHLCPVAALSRMVTTIPAPPNAPAFVVPDQGTLLTVTHRSFAQYLQLFLAKSGHPAHLYSGHSFRKGGCTFASVCNVPEYLLKIHGDWSSQQYEKYLVLPLSKRAQVTQQMRDGILAYTKR